MTDAPIVDEVVREFLVESHENLDRLDQDLLSLEQDPSSKATLASIFRTIHTIKGTCGFLGFTRLEAVAHSGENLLSRMREGEIAPRLEIFTALLSLVDAVRRILAGIEASGQEPSVDNSALVATLTELAALGPPQAASRRSSEGPRVAGDVERQGRTSVVAPPSIHGLSSVTAESRGEHPHLPTVIPPPDMPPSSKNWLAAPRAMTGPEPLAVPPVSRKASVELTPSDTADVVPEARLAVADSYVRVDVSVLDTLMDLVGELVLARNQTLQFASTIDDASFLASTQRLNLITTELQGGIMKTRMQPIGNILGKFPRLVRDLSHACGKKVRLELIGTDTELDRTIIEAIKDPLTHLIRNAVDHGIERPEVRKSAGKNVEGTVSLRAFHEGGQVNLDISDDGRGILPDKVKERAIQRGLLKREEAGRMTEREIRSLIFLPGFSTADKVTNVSGRGVGMDVVKTNIEKIGGTIDVQSQPGQGMQLRIKIPLTLAIIPALIVTTAGERYAIPQVNLLELVRLEGEQARASIETIFGAQVYRLRGSLLPVVKLTQALSDDPSAPSARGAENAVNIVVVQADGRQFGLVVDEISDTQEIVVKPLGKQLKGGSLFAGATILGDGTVALILDVIGLAQRSNVLSAVRERQVHTGTSSHEAAVDQRQALLLFGVHEDGWMAMPLSLVARLEEFPRSVIERAGGADVVQYRGEIMPLCDLSTEIPERRRAARGAGPSVDERDTVPVVVFAARGRSVGLVVDRIHDVVEETLTVQRASNRPCILGSTVIQGRVTELLDVYGIVRTMDPTFADLTP